MVWRVVELDPAQQCRGRLYTEYFFEAGAQMRVEVVQDQLSFVLRSYTDSASTATSVCGGVSCSMIEMSQSNAASLLCSAAARINTARKSPVSSRPSQAVRRCSSARG